MSKEFIIDKQTLEDLNIPGRYRPLSVFSIYNQVKTAGGGKLLQEMFARPLTDMDGINQRSSIFLYFHQKDLLFPFDKTVLADAEELLSGSKTSNLLAAYLAIFRMKLSKEMVHGVQYDKLQRGIAATIRLLKTVETFFPQLKGMPDAEMLMPARRLLEDEGWQKIKHYDTEGNLPVPDLARCYLFLTPLFSSELKSILNMLYHLDVYISVSRLSRERGWTYALAMPPDGNMLHIAGLTHPALKDGVGNTLDFDTRKNLLFLTGANMAGKSTLMKALGISIYLAHMGFPVPAASMQFSVRDGLFTSVNVADSLENGFSHFYAEVRRVKHVAQMVREKHDLVIIFDELFKGTNVKDAYDATLAVTEAFAAYRNCFYVISTHIIEVAGSLREKCNNVHFRFMPTLMDDSRPVATYKLTEGVSADRQGMLIVRNEGILKLLGIEEESLQL